MFRFVVFLSSPFVSFILLAGVACKAGEFVVVAFASSNFSGVIGENYTARAFTAVTHNIRIRVMLKVNAWDSMDP